jgi:nucleoside-diphosphate-sugar epimerase
MRAGAAANLAAFEGLLEAAARAGVRRVVQASSVVVHDGWPVADISRDSPVTPPPGPPASYRAAKIAAEAHLRRFARETGAAVAILRPTLVCGKGSRLWTGAVAERLLAGPVVLPEGEDGLCHFVDVADVARAALRAVLAGPGPGEARAYLVSGPGPVTWAEFYAAHAARLGRGATVREPLASLRARLGPETPGPSGPSPAARASALARRLLGSRRVDGLAARLRALRGGGGVHRPDRSLLALYLGQGRIDLAATVAELGWAPRTDLEASLDGSFGASPGTSHGNPA